MPRPWRKHQGNNQPPLNTSQSFAKHYMGVKMGDTKLQGRPWNKTVDTIEVGLSCPNRQSNSVRNLREDSQDIRPFGISFTRHLSRKDAAQRNMRRPSTLGLWCSQRAKDRVGELGKSVDRKSRSPKKPSPTTETQAEPQSLGKY